MFNDKTTTCLLESCSSHFILLHEAVKASKNTALYNFTRSTAGVEHPQYGCIRTATIKGYYILFKDCAAYHGPGWQFEGWGQSGFDLAKLVCNGSIVLLHYFTDPCSYLHCKYTRFDPQVWYTTVNSCSNFFPTKSIHFFVAHWEKFPSHSKPARHTHSLSLKKSGCCYSVKLWVLQNSFLILLLSSSLANIFPPSANYTWAMTWSIQHQLIASLLPHTSWLQCTGG